MTLTNNDIAFSSSTQSLYATVPSAAGSNGNSITPVDPATGAIGTSAFIGSEPTKMAISDDGQTIYAALDGAAGVRRFNVDSQTAGLQFPLSSGFPLFANDLSVMPGNPNAVAVSRSNRVSFPDSDGVAIYENGVRRTNVAAINSYSVEFSNLPTRLYSQGFVGTAGSGAFDRLSADASGVTELATVQIIRGGDLRFDNGLLYTTGGDVVDPESGVVQGSFTILSSYSNAIMTTDVALGRAFFLTTDSSAVATLRAFDLNTFVPLGTVDLGTVTDYQSVNAPSRLVRWGQTDSHFAHPPGSG